MTPSPHEIRFRVRYGETDQMGVVYHANYLHYMEEGRGELMRSLGATYAEFERAGWGLAVRKAQLRFRVPAVYDDELAVLTCVERVCGASVTFAYRILRAADRKLLAEGTTELVCLNTREDPRRPTLLPDELRRLLESAVVPA